MKCVVTGGAGFLGSHLCERLAGQGHEVIAVDNLFTGDSNNIAGIDGVTLVNHDVCVPFPKLSFSSGEGVDRVYNLACPASPPHYQRDPIFTMKTSVLGALNGLEFAQKHGARFLQASTSEVYGDPEVHPQTEDYLGAVNTLGPRACYDEGKRAAEALCMDFRRVHNVDARIMRIFNTYGPRMDPKDGRVVSNFIMQALRGDPITIYGEGHQTRSFCYVDDLVDGITALMEHESAVGPINLGNAVERTIRDLARIVLELTDGKSELVQKPLPKDDPKRRRPDLTRASEVLGYAPKVTLEEGIKKSLPWFRSMLPQ